jgi:hypothetical protein
MLRRGCGTIQLNVVTLEKNLFESTTHKCDVFQNPFSTLIEGVCQSRGLTGDELKNNSCRFIYNAMLNDCHDNTQLFAKLRIKKASRLLLKLF